MNKKLLAVAIGAALASAPMFANAAATVYGSAHLSIDSIDNGNLTNNTATSMYNNASYLGFKAEDDIGGGMKAFFGAELQLTLDTGVTNFSNRNTTAGLTGGFGTVRLGNYDDVLKQVGRKVDFFMSEQLGESRSLTHVGTWDARLADSVTYATPSMGGVTATLNYGLENTFVDGAGLTAKAVGVEYSGGPLYVGAAYKTVDASATTDTSAIRVSVMGTMGPVKVGGLYQKVTGVTGATDRDTYGVGASFKIGSGSIKGQYYVAGDLDGTVNSGATLMAVGYDHSLSKTTTVYAVFASVDNDTNGAFQVVSGAGHGTPATVPAGLATTAGNEGKGLSLGMKVVF